MIVAEKTGTDWLFRVEQSDADLGVDPTAYVYHRFEWTGSAKDFYSDGDRRSNPTYPPHLLTEVLNRPSLSVGTTDHIDQAAGWMIRTAREAFPKLEFSRPLFPGETQDEYREWINQLKDGFASRMDWSLKFNRHELRIGRAVCAAYSLLGARRLWLCVFPKVKNP